MKRFKFFSYVLVLIAFFSLSACGEDAVLQEIIDNTELNAPLETTGQSGDDDGKPAQ